MFLLAHHNNILYFFFYTCRSAQSNVNRWMLEEIISNLKFKRCPCTLSGISSPHWKVTYRNIWQTETLIVTPSRDWHSSDRTFPETLARYPVIRLGRVFISVFIWHMIRDESSCPWAWIFLPSQMSGENTMKRRLQRFAGYPHVCTWLKSSSLVGHGRMDN